MVDGQPVNVNVMQQHAAAVNRTSLLDNKMGDMEMVAGDTRPSGQSSNAGSLNQVPEARTDHTFVRYKNRFYVYGGRDEVQIFKDIHEYSIASN